MVVSPEPFSSRVFHLLDRSKQILSEPLVPDGSIVALDVRILLGFARLDVLDGNPTLLGPRQERATDQFRAVVHPNGQWLSSSSR